MRLESSELRTFIAVIENNGFNRAAEHLHISQSAVSQSVANLEAKLESPLIARGKQLKLTAAGKRLLDYAQQSLLEEQQTLEDISRINRGDNATLSVATNSSITQFYAPQLLSLFCRQHPRAQLNIQQLPSRNIIYAVLAGRVELGMGPLQKQMVAHDTLPLYKEVRQLMISPRHPQSSQLRAAKNPASQDKILKQTTLITSSLDEPEMRPGMQRIRDQFANVWEVGSLSLRIQLVDQGLGAAYISRKLLSTNPLCQDFVHINKVAFGDIERQVGLYYKSGKTLSASALAFIEVCQGFFAGVEG